METEKNTENVWKAEQKNKENVENQAYQINILYQKIIRGSRQKRQSQSWKNSQKKQTIKA